MPIYFFLFLAVFGLANFYVFIRGWQVIPPGMGFRPAYAIVYWLAAFSFFAARGLVKILPFSIADILEWIGSFWIAAITYLFLVTVIVDALRALNHFLPFFPAAIAENYARAKYATAGVVLGIVALILLFGYINARIPRVTELELFVDKQAGELKNLNIAAASDLHLGTIVGRAWLASAVDKINALSPDIVLLPGDVLDGDAAVAYRKNHGSELLRIQAHYGVFAVMGNHEYYGGGGAVSSYLAEHNIVVLRDKSVKIGDSFYIVGREDRSSGRYSGQPRKDLKVMTDALDKRLPVIMMDHQPYDLHEAAENGIDLQLSGHTHYGQLWPVNYVIRAMYELAWGYKRKGDTHYYVSSGVCAWGPPVRTTNRSEIVHIRLIFRDGS